MQNKFKNTMEKNKKKIKKEKRKCKDQQIIKLHQMKKKRIRKIISRN